MRGLLPWRTPRIEPVRREEKAAPGMEIIVEIIAVEEAQDPTFAEIHQGQGGPGRLREVPEEAGLGRIARTLGEIFQKLKK